MNDRTYAQIREIAKEIREDAVSRNDGKTAIANFRRATGYLFEQIHSANDITFGDKNEFADSLIILAEKIKSKDQAI